MADMNKWVKGSMLSYIIISILNFIFVILKEGSPAGGGFKQFMVDFGGVFGIDHHLYGHIVFLLFTFIILILLFVYVPAVGDGFANAIKMNDYVWAAYHMIIFTALSAIVILGYMATVAFGE